MNSMQVRCGSQLQFSLLHRFSQKVIIMKSIRRTLAAGLAAGALVALTACGSGSPSGSSTTSSADGSSSETLVKIGMLPVGPNAVLLAGDKDGYFAKHGLKAEINTGLDGPAQIPGLTTGAINFSLCNPTSLLVANDKGLDIRLVSSFTNSLPTGQDHNAVVVKKDSGINSFKDLAGKTVSVNATATAGDLLIKAAVKKDGGDPSAIKFNEIQFSDMEAQLENGNTEAVWFPEPFQSKAASNPKMKILGYPMQYADPGVATQMICADGKWADANKETVTKFRDALTELLDAAQKDDTIVRKELPDFLKMPKEVADKVGLDHMSTTIDRPSLEVLNKLMVEYGMISKEVDLDAITVK